MANKRNLAAIGSLGRRPSRTLQRDPGSGRATAQLGASDINLSSQFTVDDNQRLSIKKAATVALTTQSGATAEATLNQLITNLRAAGILEG